MNEPICLNTKCTKSAKILTCRIKAGKKFCSTVCAAQYALDHTLELKWCSKHIKWEDEETDCERYIPRLVSEMEDDDESDDDR